MRRTKQELDEIYERSSGYCHLCHKKLSRRNYGVNGARGAWHVEHSRPQAKGGTNHPNNLFAACVGCNCSKQDLSTQTVRRWNGKSRAPLNPKRRRQAKLSNGVIGALVGGVAGAVVAGPAGAVVGAVAGARFASSRNPDHD